MPLSFLQPPLSEIPTAPRLPPTLPQPAIVALWQGRIAEAIRLVRLEQNIRLNEARNLIDTYLQSRPTLKNRIDTTQADAREGLLRWLIFLLAGGGGLRIG